MHVATAPTPPRPRLAATAAKPPALGTPKTDGRADTTVVALDDVTLDVTAREFTAFMGPSGSDWSNAGLDTPTSGHVRIRRHTSVAVGPREVARGA